MLDRYRLRPQPSLPTFSIGEEKDGRISVGIDSGSIDPEEMLKAWKMGSGFMPLVDGGFAPLPTEWLQENAWWLMDLLALRDQAGKVPLHAVPTISALMEATDSPTPPSFQQLRAMLDNFDGLPPVPQPQGLLAELRPYQRHGLDWLGFLKEAGLGGILADDMGLGKTLQVLCILARTTGRHLVVAPTSVMTGWLREAERFLPHLKMNLYHGPSRSLDTKSGIVVTSYAILRRDIEILEKHSWAYAVLDEAQAIKNPDSQAARAARRLSARWRLAVTGTPVENRLEELWSIFAFAMPGLLGNRKQFSSRIETGLVESHTTVQDHATTPRPGLPPMDWLRKRVRPFILRRLKRQVAPDLPPRVDMVIACTMEEDQRRTYDAIRNTSRSEVVSAIGTGRTLQVLEALLRMRQAACHPALLPGAPTSASAKVATLLEYLRPLVQEGHKALIFSQWTAFLDLLEPVLRDAGISWCRLDGSTRHRQKTVDLFQSPDGPPVFLISLKAGGTGLNLTAADYVFHMDPWWNPAVEDQAVDRAHRIGQDRKVISCRLITAGTLEEKILELQHSKRRLAQMALGSEDSLTSSLTKDELLSLFN